MNEIPKKDASGFYRVTLDERGMPCLNGEKLNGVRSYTLDVDDLAIATLTVTLYVTLDPKVGFDSGGDDIGGD